jgi:DNA-binding transcriptional LysR family regulator
MAHRALEERRVDLIVLHMHSPISRQHLHVEALYEDAYVVVAGAQSSWVRRRRVELADLMNEPWALPPPGSAVGSIFVEAFLARGLDYPRMVVSTQTMPARAALAATGQFLSIVPGSALNLSTGNAALKPLPVALPTTRRPTGILTFKNRTLSPAAQLFIDCARDVAKLLAKPLRAGANLRSAASEHRHQPERTSGVMLF